MNPALRPAAAEDFEFAFKVKRDAIGPYVAARWGWDEALQLGYHQRRWQERPWQLIIVDDIPVGTVSIDVRPTHLQLGEFYILGPYRGKGLGTRVLLHALEVADGRRSETRLEYLKWNPVATLYSRHDFHVVGENESHYLAVRLPNGA